MVKIPCTSFTSIFICTAYTTSTFIPIFNIPIPNTYISRIYILHISCNLFLYLSKSVNLFLFKISLHTFAKLFPFKRYIENIHHFFIILSTPFLYFVFFLFLCWGYSRWACRQISLCLVIITVFFWRGCQFSKTFFDSRLVQLYWRTSPLFTHVTEDVVSVLTSGFHFITRVHLNLTAKGLNMSRQLPPGISILLLLLLENTVEIELQPTALDFKNLSQYSSRSK